MRPAVAVLDYGVGNLHSVARALDAAGAEVRVTDRPEEIEACVALVLPGVGAFGAAVDAMTERGLDEAVRTVAASGRPLFGVCLGYQLLFEHSEESGGRDGLGLLPGTVRRLGPERGQVPHMGWNRLWQRSPDPLLAGIADGAWVYFVHSYAAEPDHQHLVASTDHGGPVSAICRLDNVVGTQFHPEKSGLDGLRLYANFVSGLA